MCQSGKWPSRAPRPLGICFLFSITYGTLIEGMFQNATSPRFLLPFLGDLKNSWKFYGLKKKYQYRIRFSSYFSHIFKITLVTMGEYRFVLLFGTLEIATFRKKWKNLNWTPSGKWLIVEWNEWKFGTSSHMKYYVYANFHVWLFEFSLGLSRALYKISNENGW